MPRKLLQDSPSLLPGSILIIGLAAGFKFALLAADVFPFNADEAIVGLMARHILAGRWPTFFYGQAYLGSLDASLIALAFALLGQQVWVIRMVQSVLYLGTLLTTIALVYRISRSEWQALAAGLIMAIPTVNVTLYTTVSLGGYGEALLLGNLALLLGLKIWDRPSSGWLALAFGAVSGLGFWAFGLTLIYTIPAGCFVLWKLTKQLTPRAVIGRLAALGVGFGLGASPWLLWAIRNGVEPLIRELAGSAIAGASAAEGLGALAARAFNLALFGTTVAWGLRPPWEIRWLALPLMPIALAFWAAVTWHALKAVPKREPARVGHLLLLAVGASLLLGFLLTPFGSDPSGRYFVPLAAPLAFFAAAFLQRLREMNWRRLASALLAGVLAFNLAGTVQAALRRPPGITTQFDSVTWIDHTYARQAIDFLANQGVTGGYSNYWVAYPLAFLSKERLVFVPVLPYHSDFRYTPRDNRYEPYEDLVAKSERVAYITTHHPELDQVLKSAFEAVGVEYEETRIGDYHVYYGLSEAVAPADLGALPWEPEP